MKILYFDCFAGASGDMIVASLLDLGVDIVILEEELRKIELTDYTIKVEKVINHSISSLRFDVLLGKPGETSLADKDFTEAQEKKHIPDSFITSTKTSSEHRHLNEILELITRSSLSPVVKDNACKIFTRLGKAESKVHGVPLDQVHFHEVGSIDAIIDVVCACVCIDILRIEKIVVSPLHLGTGLIHSSHGILPVPAPATSYLIQGFPVYSTEITGELLTPTGAAILTTLADKFSALPEMVIQNIGYGVGHREREFPNILRAFMGEDNLQQLPPSSIIRNPYPEQHETAPGPGGYHENSAVILEANIDDMSPQLFGHLMDQLLDSGALDVTFTPVQMKKNRPGIKIQILSSPDQVESLMLVIFKESTTIGIRSYPVTKHMLQRESLDIMTKYGKVRVKVARLGEKIVNILPEYEDCLAIASKHQISLKEVMNQATLASQKLIGN